MSSAGIFSTSLNNGSNIFELHLSEGMITKTSRLEGVRMKSQKTCFSFCLVCRLLNSVPVIPSPLPSSYAFCAWWVVPLRNPDYPMGSVLEETLYGPGFGAGMRYALSFANYRNSSLGLLHVTKASDGSASHGEKLDSRCLLRPVQRHHFTICMSGLSYIRMNLHIDSSLLLTVSCTLAVVE